MAGISSVVKTAEGRNIYAPSRGSETVPEKYGDTRIVLMPRDPYWAFSYWELTEESVGRIIRRHGRENVRKAKLLLRVNDITGINYNGRNAHKYFDITVTGKTNNWYINMPEINRDWCVDLGLLLPDGRFVKITRSNSIHMPRYGVSEVIDERWGMMHNEFERILKLSRVDLVGRSSLDVSKLMKEKWEGFMSVSSLRASPMGISSFRPAPAAQKKNFWLKANTELIVYGTTESDAHLTVCGEPVALRPDGSFSVRFSLNDGQKYVPVTAKSKDKTFKKSINFTVDRKMSSDFMP